MNTKILYFILFLVIGRYFVNVEKLDINVLMEEKMDKINNKVGNNTENTLDSGNESNLALQAGYNENVDNTVEAKIQDALGKNNAVVISSEEGKFEDQTIVNEPVVDSNNEKAGGLNNQIVIIGVILMLLFFLKK